MAIKLGNTNINVFGNNWIKAYLGNTLVLGGAVQYILDLYPNAASAYSLRQLKTGVTNVVRVRRSSDNTEQDFTPSEITDGTLTTFTGAGDGFVSVWYDQSGNGVNSFNTTANEQPKIVSNGALILEGGVPSLLFSSGQQLDTGAVTISSEDYSFFGVAKCSTSGSEAIVRCRDLGVSGSVEGVTFYELASGSTSNMSIDNGNGDSLIPSIGDAVSQVKHLISTLYTTNTGDFYVDTSKVGVQQVVVGSLPIGNVALPYINIGGRRYNRGLDGTIQEIIIYDNNKQSDRGNIEADINDYYTIF